MNTQRLLSLIQKSRDGKTFFKNLTDSEVKTLQNIIKKFLKGKLKVTPNKMSKLARYKKPMRKIARINVKKVKSTRRALRQIGFGLFSVLLPAALSLITGLLTKKK